MDRESLRSIVLAWRAVAKEKLFELIHLVVDPGTIGYLPPLPGGLFWQHTQQLLEWCRSQRGDESAIAELAGALQAGAPAGSLPPTEREAVLRLWERCEMVLSALDNTTPTLDSAHERIVCAGQEYILEETEARVLDVLVEKQTASLCELKAKTDIDRPDRVLRSIRDKYPFLRDAIRLPGKKGRGGYGTSIKRA